MIYLDNAATTLRKPPEVGEAVLRALGTLGNSARGAHEGALDAARTVYGARCRLAELFHCERPDHVAFAANVTAALNTAICGLIRPGDHVISTELEHNSVLRPLRRLAAERDVRLELLPADRQGNIDLNDLERLLRPDTRAVVCTHASNLTGNIVDVDRVGAIARAHGAYFIVDAAQTAGSRPVDMENMGADVLCFTGHKGLMGPQGTGGLCLRPGVPVRPFAVGGTGVMTYSPSQPDRMPTRLEAGTLNSHGIAGLSAALDWLRETGIDRIEAKERDLTQRFYEGARAIPGVVIYGDFSRDHAAIVALNIRDADSGAVADALWERFGIAVRSGAHCAPLLHEALGTRDQGAVRFSFSWYNTAEEIDRALEAVDTLARGS